MCLLQSQPLSSISTTRMPYVAVKTALPMAKSQEWVASITTPQFLEAIIDALMSAKSLTRGKTDVQPAHPMLNTCRAAQIVKTSTSKATTSPSTNMMPATVASQDRGMSHRSPSLHKLLSKLVPSLSVVRVPPICKAVSRATTMSRQTISTTTTHLETQSPSLLKSTIHARSTCHPPKTINQPTHRSPTISFKSASIAI